MKQQAFDSPMQTEDALEIGSGTVMKNGDLNESTATSVTGDSYSEEETGWLGGIGADFRTLAISLRETAGGVASFVHRSAINVANEIALLEQEGGLNDEDMGGEPLHLPWEIKNSEGKFEEDEELKKKIFALSSHQSTFMEPFSSAKKNEHESGSFTLDEPRVQVIRQLLKIDHQLSSMHARLSGRSDIREATFWRNYFHACSATREKHLEELELDKELEVDSQDSLNSLVPDDECSRSNDDGNASSKADDDSSFLCLGSVKSSGMKSVGSLVLVEAVNKPPSSLNLP